MAIQNRRGNYSDFDPNKLMPGEWAVVQSGDPNSTSGRSVYMAFDTNVVTRMATYEDMQNNISSATSDIRTQFTQELTDAINNANDTVDDLQDDVDTLVTNTTNTVNTLVSNSQSAVNIAVASAQTATRNANDAADAANDAVEAIQEIIDSGNAVLSWNGRTGNVEPQSGDYASSQITHGAGTVATALTFDSTPTAGSTRAVQSGGVFSKLGNATMGTTATTLTGAVAELKAAIDALQESLVWKKLSTSPTTGKNVFQTIPDTANEMYIRVGIITASSDKVWVGFTLPVIDDMFGTGTYRIVNYYGTTSDGYVAVKFLLENNLKKVGIMDAHNGNTDLASPQLDVYYR